MDTFLNNDDIVSSSSARNETWLERTDDVIQKGAKTSHKSFGNHLINSVTKPNGTKLSDGFRVVRLGDETQKGFD